jgi:hypothetical protein
MKNILKRVNYFFQRFDQHTASIAFLTNTKKQPIFRRSPCPAWLPLPFCVSVIAREAEFYAPIPLRASVFAKKMHEGRRSRGALHDKPLISKE